MLIAIDANEANVGKRVGVNQFSFELLNNIYQLRKNSRNYQYLNFRIFLNSDPLPDFPPSTEWWQYEVFGPKKLWTLTGLVKRLFLGRPRPDILFSPSHYGPAFSPIPFVISIMDLGFLRWPEQFTKKDYFQLKYWTKKSTKKAAKIITISEFSKRDIVKNYKIDNEKIIVIYPGVYGKKINIKSQQKKDYFIYVGTLKPSKNIKRLIEAFNKLDKKEFKLMIVGKKGWLYKDIFKLVKKLKLEKRIVFTGFTKEKEKQQLIADARALVLPSLWEGFGIPILEAMAVGTLVVCSRVASLPEVADKAAIYIDNPQDVDSIAQALAKVLKLNEAERKKLINNGFKQFKKFSWRRSAELVLEELIEFYERQNRQRINK